jgi:CRISPR-associated protein Cmr2
MSKYIALTIGPMDKIFKATKRTRHLWGASYLFSYFMREVIKKVPRESILVPFVDEKSLNAKTGAGLFPDVLLLKSDTMGVGDLKKIVDEVVVHIAEKGNEKSVALHQLLNFYLFECEESEGGDNPILVLQEHLHTMEQMPMYQAEDNFPLTKFLDKINGALFYSDAGRPTGFPSIADIATIDLTGEDAYKKIKKELEEDEDQELMKRLSHDKDLKDKVLNYHHYIAVIQADGDNIGKTIGNIGKKGNEDTMNKFSKDLFAFSTEALEVIKDYGGEPVFAGGDDLLFFAPLANRNNNDCSTIFQLMAKIDAIFTKKLTNVEAYHTNGNAGKTHKPTLSFGVAIAYYKFPLGESRSSAGSALFVDAKKGNKNAVALTLQKHSHSKPEINLYYEKGSADFNNLIVNDLIKLMTDKDAIPLLHSVAQIFSAQSAMLKEIAADTANCKARLGYFFKHNFNESVHKKYHDIGGFFDKLIQGIELAVTTYGVEKGLKMIEQFMDIQHFIHRKTKD